MRKLMMIAMLIVPFFAYSQRNTNAAGNRQNMTTEQRAEQRAKVLKAKLNLNDQQYKDVVALLKERMNKEEAVREQLKQDRQKSEQEIEKLLSEEQLKTYRQMQENMHERRQEKLNQRN